MKYLLIFSLSLALSCSKTKESTMDTRPLKAVPTASVNGKVITLTADKSEGDVCAYGWALTATSPTQSTVSYSPNSSIQGDKNPDRDVSGQPYYLKGTLKYTPVMATVTKTGNYIFSLQVLDANKNESWADITIEVK